MKHTHERDEDLPGAAIVVGKDVVGQVQGVLRDQVSRRVRYLISLYGGGAGAGRRVAVPMEWVGRRSPTRLVLGVSTRDLDRLPAYEDPPRLAHPAAQPAASGVTVNIDQF